MSNTFDKLSVLDPFIEEVNSYLPEIEANLERLAQAPDDMDALEETYRRTHTIGGSASMMDFPGLAHVAHGMEDILGDALDGLLPLDASTLALLGRSLGRVRLLLNGIRGGVSEAPILAEDDADFEQYRARVAANSQAMAQTGEESKLPPAVSPSSSTPATTYTPFEQVSSSPSFDEVLASFQSPPTDNDEVAWPEEAHLSSPPAYDEHSTAPLSSEKTPAEPSRVARSALDELVASVSQSHPIVTNPARTPLSMDVASSQTEKAPLASAEEAVTGLAHVKPSTPSTPLMPPTPAPHTVLLPEVYIEAQHEAQTLEAHVASLAQVVAQLRASIMTIETQRSEFKSFLDGSKDALERMEDWAGRAMGLNLRNSPEQVRRYLPLSVMWVSNTKLKKVQDALHQITNGVELTDEQLQGALQQLQASLIACGEAFQRLQQHTQQGTGYLLRQEPGWTPWEMQSNRQPASGHTVRERVTFERRGDMAALRAEIEAQLRAELQNEYATTLAARAELEQQIRKEVRQEFEARRQLQSQVAGGDRESLAELEARLRSEIEIQVRQEFLETITSSGADIDTFARPAAAPVTSNFLDRAREATGTADSSAHTLQTDPSVSQMQQKTRITAIPASQTGTSITSAPLSSTQPPIGSAPSSAGKTSPVQGFTSDFGEEATEIFRIEAEEHLQSISMHAAALEKSPASRELIQGIRRATHTLKGAAGMMGFRAIADLCHISEDLLDSIMEGTTPISPAILSIILDTAETLDSLITGRGADAAGDEARVQGLRKRYAALLGGRTTFSQDDEESEAELEGHEEGGVEARLAIVSGEEEQEAQRTAPGDLSVRVRLQKLDELVNLFGELLVNRSVLEERIQRMARIVADVSLSSNRLRDVGQKLESNFEAATLPSGRSIQVMPGEGDQANSSRNGNAARNGKSDAEPSHLAEFDELELDRYTEFHRLARGLSEGISDMTTLSAEMEAVVREAEGVFSRESRLSTTFQDRLMKVRLVPLSTMAPRLYRAARSVALKQHKDFEFLLEGEETEVDRTVYEEIAGPLLHLMRNAVNHAIETPEVRVQKGKPPTGVIKLSAAYEGNQVVITVRDDGTGIDPEHVRNAAIARGLISPDQVLSENDLIELIFRPGFSTAEVVSEESGRGVGLDVVRDSVSRFRGTIEVESTPGQGTAFTMKFPTSLAIQSAMMVGVGGQQFAIPTVMVESIGRLDTFKRAAASGQPAVVVRNDLYPLHMLSQYLSLPTRPLDEKSQLLLVNAGGQRVALVVDEIKGKMDVVTKSLGPHLRNVRGIAGGTVLGNGQVVLILELLELLEMRSKVSVRHESVAQPQMPQMPQIQQASSMPIKKTIAAAANRPAPSPVAGGPTANAPVAERGRYVLVVDDSPSVRRVVSNMLKQNRWEVQMARDGVEALEIIAQETPAAVLLDIEMPRMDGYELIATVRAQEQYRTLPLIVLTSRAASKHQQRAMQLGASAYVVKPYQDEELLKQLNALVYGYGAAAR
jgi:chemotaxis protein histidine kinase CheA/ActR/RegA family two-component response regulator